MVTGVPLSPETVTSTAPVMALGGLGHRAFGSRPEYRVGLSSAADRGTGGDGEIRCQGCAAAYDLDRYVALVSRPVPGDRLVTTSCPGHRV